MSFIFYHKGHQRHIYQFIDIMGVNESLNEALMNYQTILLIMISLSVFIDLIFVLVRFHQYKKEPLKEVFEIFTKEAYQKVISYHQKLNVFNLTKFVFKSIILFLIIYFHVMYSIYTYLNEQVTIEPFNSELFILIIFTLLFLGIEIVFDIYKTF